MTYAVKVMVRKGRDIVDEVQAMASLSANCEQSNIVRYYSAWVEENKLYLQMEHCQESLHAQHRRGRVEEGTLKKVLSHVLKALKYLHGQQIVHLDIKPDNILLSHQGQYKLADLGLARITSGGQDIEEGDCRFLAQEVLTQ